MENEKKINDETREIIDSFVSEGYDLIEDAEQKIVDMENASDQNLINTIFRMFHSIKGSAGYLNFENIKLVTHEAENLLDIFRKEDVQPDQESINLLYQTLDFLKQVIVNVEKELTDEGFEEPASLIIHDIADCIKEIKSDVKEKKQEEKKKSSLINENFITKEMKDNFISEASDSFDTIEHNFILLEKDIDNIELISEIFRYVHTLKGNCGLFGYDEMERVCIDIETQLDKAREGKLKFGVKGINKLLKKIDQMRNMLLPKQTANNEKKEEKKRLGEILVDMGETSELAIDKALSLQEKNALGEILIEMGEASEKAVSEALKRQNKSSSDSFTSDFTIHKKDIRVDTTKLDYLFDTVGELITASAMVINNPDLEGLKLDNFTKAANSFIKITHDLQEITMSMRMVELETLFTKMKRLVRDLSHKSQKKVNLHISGQDTEMDRTVIEKISDPLVHLIRNAIDHGLEDQIERKKQKKEEVGNIYLTAHYEGNEIWISIQDDGKGLDRDKIIAKARERGLLNDDADKLHDDEVWLLIFEPGFSTADEVSDISGRGVGMDVVSRNIEKLRGKITVTSQKNIGTIFTLKIPLTLAIIEGITVKVGENLYSIPTTDIQEFFEIKNNNLITSISNENQVIKLRDEVVPIIKLHTAFKIKTEAINIDDGIMIVLNANNRKACILADEVIGNHQIVVKSLSEYLGSVRGISGCTIMGNGEVSLIIDSSSLISTFLD